MRGSLVVKPGSVFQTVEIGTAEKVARTTQVATMLNPTQQEKPQPQTTSEKPTPSAVP